jgi:hypothetical protein
MQFNPESLSFAWDTVLKILGQECGDTKLLYKESGFDLAAKN